MLQPVFMKKYLILYYSKTGNSQFIAEKLAKELGGDALRLEPVISGIAALFLLSALNVRVPILLTKEQISAYDEVIILGPIWGGQLLAPLRSAIRACKKAARPFHFAVTCETSDEEKDSQYGYSQVLRKARELGGTWACATEAFPMPLVDGYVRPQDATAEKTRVTEANYSTALRKRVKVFAEKIKSGISI
jgi:flavodoxin